MNALTLAERVANLEKQNADLVGVLQEVYQNFLTTAQLDLNRNNHYVALLRSRIRASLDNAKGEQHEQR